MQNFECNSIGDLVFNRSFREWVLSPTTADTGFWENWIAAHPAKKEMINHSKAIIYALQHNLTGLSDEMIDIEIRNVLQKINTIPANEAEPGEDDYPTRRLLSVRFRILLAAAIFTGLIIASFFLLRSPSSPKPMAVYESFLSSQKDSSAEQVNNNDTAELVTLPDGSTALLEPGSKLAYAKNFSAVNREVYLTGEAFFDVRKNPSRPFLVFTNSIITKVLGTSFRVRAYTTDPKVIITVRTGKVSVFKTKNFNTSYKEGTAMGGIVVTRNQAVVYNSSNSSFNKTLAEQPVIVPAPDISFSFDATPVKQVFKAMEDAYGIPFVYDEETMSGCSLSAGLGNEPFYDKLNIICRAINASYEMIDGNIVITSGGCKK